MIFNQTSNPFAKKNNLNDNSINFDVNQNEKPSTRNMF